MRCCSICAFVILFAIQSGAVPPNEATGDSHSETVSSVDNDTYIDANRILMFVTNTGAFGRDLADMFSHRGPGTYFPYYGVENIENGTNAASVLYAAGLWAGGVDAGTGDTLVTVAEYSSEYVPGPMAGGTYLPDRPEFKVYRLHSDSLASNPNSDYTNWPVDQGAPVDNYGVPVMLGDQMLWSVFNDANPVQHTNNSSPTDPLGIEIQQTTWAFDVSTGPLANTIFVKYRIQNKGLRALEDFYLSLWFDPDLGGSGDDLVGCDTVNQTMICYNGDNDDRDYGTTPPAFGVKVMYGPLVAMPGVTGYFDGTAIADHWNLPMTAFTKYINGTDPDSYRETYAYMKGLCAKETGFPSYEYDGKTLTFVHSGDPIAGTGDLDNDPDDKRMMASFGPLDFASGEVQFMQFAIVAAQGSDRLSSLINLNNSMLQLGPERHLPVAITVPGDYETIQAAIDVAWPGDTVRVAPGTYTGDGNRDLDFHGKNIVVRSDDGPEVTIIDCGATNGDDHRGFYFHGGETHNAMVQGFTISNGGWYARSGGAILIENGSEPTISDCIFFNCRGEYGGAISCLGSAPMITSNRFSYNRASEDGGAIFLRGSSATISGNTMSNNRAEYGGAMFCDSCDVLVSHNVITDNYVEEAGSGLYFFKGHPEIRNNDISDNVLDEGLSGGNGIGAGIYCWVSSAVIADNTISRNLCGPGILVSDNHPARGGGIYTYAGAEILISGNEVTSNRGGGISCDYSYNLTITGNTVSNNVLNYMGFYYDGRLNSAGIEVFDNAWSSVVNISNNVCTHNGAYAGGGILVDADDVTITDCWLEDNRGSTGSGMYLKGDDITVSNCVIVNNIAPSGTGGGVAVADCSPTLENCTIANNRAGTSYGSALFVSNATPVFDKCIVAGHDFGTLITCELSGVPTFIDSDIYGNAGGDWVGCLAGQADINNNFSIDPVFCDADNGDYQLSATSPCAPDNSFRELMIGALGIGCYSFECGDVDWDGEITAADVEFFRDFYFSDANEWRFPIAAGDLDCDGEIRISDLILLAGYYYGYGPDPCCVPPPKRPDQPKPDKNDGPPSL